MPHAYSRIWIHLVFATKDRQTFIGADLKTPLYETLNQELTNLKCFPLLINGMPDHVHILYRHNPLLSIADVVKQIKGATAYQVNHQGWIPQQFSWQSGYGAFSVSESQLDKVQQYIANQEAHHRTKTFQEEWEGLLRVHHLLEG
ncbi:REP element-mobilizing transposase RayT [Cnuella takakiae]|uniref:REP element-mobilizing transposase RayT n=1 Tax=Cnuella takakiae TaxID=1302690 RepID=A0A1M5F495_9BACT|nr:IS200/IS605 family transposase [Cnuella takakiae]OLY90965.1 transposase [Cnuella takakiae]SHF86208.1 REP element-mobilizing transposase RayT [Cnuella takakiae]